VDLLGLGKDVPHCRLQLPSFMPALVAPDDWLSRQKRGNANVTPSNFVVRNAERCVMGSLSDEHVSSGTATCPALF
jgi:hypothetical protein